MNKSREIFLTTEKEMKKLEKKRTARGGNIGG